MDTITDAVLSDEVTPAHRAPAGGAARAGLRRLDRAAPPAPLERAARLRHHRSPRASCAPAARWRAAMRAPDGTEHRLDRHLPRDRRRPSGWSSPTPGSTTDGRPGPETLVTVTFDAVEGGTLMRFTQTGFASPRRRDGHGGGWTECFERLDAYLASERLEPGSRRRYGRLRGGADHGRQHLPELRRPLRRGLRLLRHACSAAPSRPSTPGARRRSRRHAARAARQHHARAAARRRTA